MNDAPVACAAGDAEARNFVVETVVRAFEFDPAFRYFFPSDSEYREQSRHLVEYLFDKRVAQGTAWAIAEAQAVALWDHPRSRLSASDIARDESLGVRLSQAIGRDAAKRLALYDAATTAAFPDNEEYWYLGILAVDPDHQGTGLGSAILKDGMARAHAEGLPAYLETTNPDNVPYYRYHGWDLVQTIETEFGLSIWILRTA